MAHAALLTLTIAELAPRIKAREISPVDLTEAVLAQADRLQPTLNSFITLLPEQARRHGAAHPGLERRHRDRLHQALEHGLLQDHGLRRLLDEIRAQPRSPDRLRASRYQSVKGNNCYDGRVARPRKEIA